ncbi:MAG: Clp protease ClpP [Veillonella caviae]|nr:Clp protease ClpP [Veillonella caviae]
MKFLTVKNMNDTSADIYINGDIVDDMWKGWQWGDDLSIYPSDIKDMLSEYKGKSITFYINSGGGDVFAGMAIANMIKRHDGHTTAVVDGIAASIATQIMFACDEVIVPENAFIMIHKPSMNCSGNADDFTRAVEILNVIQTGIEKAYLENAVSGVTAERITELVNQESWFTGIEAAQYFDITVSDAINAVAYAGEYFNKWPKRPKLENQEKLIQAIEKEKKVKEAKNNVEIALALAEV